MEESRRMKKFREARLLGCFDNTGVTSENYKDFICRPERLNETDHVGDATEMICESPNSENK